MQLVKRFARKIFAGLRKKPKPVPSPPLRKKQVIPPRVTVAQRPVIRMTQRQRNKRKKRKAIEKESRRKNIGSYQG